MAANSSNPASTALCVYVELPCVACIDATCKLDTAQIALFAGVGRRRIKLATSLECQQVFGFAPGTVPPFGHRVIETLDSDGVVVPEDADKTTRKGVRPAIFVDRSLKRFEYLVGGGASYKALLWVSSKAFFSVIEIEAIGDIQRGTGLPSLSSSLASMALSTSTTSRQGALSSADASPTVSARNDSDDTNAVEIEMKFLADAMVARVGKWMRTIGIDVVIWDPSGPALKTNGGRDPKAGLLGLAAREQRVVLTRDKKLADRRDAGACFVVSSDDPFQQFQEIKTHFALQLRKDEMMSRCAVCNAKSFKRVDAAYARAQTAFEVPARVLEIVDEFWVCTLCDKIFWEGPKFSSAYDNVMRMFDDAYEPETTQGWHRERAA